MSNDFAYGDGISKADFLFLESYTPANSSHELSRWELVTEFGTTEDGCLSFVADYRHYRSTKVKEFYVDSWNYTLCVFTESGAYYKFSFCAPYGRADYRQVEDNFHDLVRRSGLDS